MQAFVLAAGFAPVTIVTGYRDDELRAHVAKNVPAMDIRYVHGRFGAAFSAGPLRKLLTYYASTFDRNCYYELILGILIYMREAHWRVPRGGRKTTERGC
jgi:hypothetical protein